jgi:hypothetical protein
VLFQVALFPERRPSTSAFFVSHPKQMNPDFGPPQIVSHPHRLASTSPFCAFVRDGMSGASAGEVPRFRRRENPKNGEVLDRRTVVTTI